MDVFTGLTSGTVLDGRYRLGAMIARGGMSTVYRGVDRETYSCTPVCQRRVTLGDAAPYFAATLGQAGNFDKAADGAAASAKN